MLTSGRTESVHDAPTIHDHNCRDAKPTNERNPIWGLTPLNPIFWNTKFFGSLRYISYYLSSCFTVWVQKNPQTIRKELSADNFYFAALQRNFTSYCYRYYCLNFHNRYWHCRNRYDNCYWHFRTRYYKGYCCCYWFCRSFCYKGYW